MNLLVTFNPTIAAHKIFAAYKSLLQIRRGQKEIFKLYVNLFEAAVSELRSLTGQAEHMEGEQLLAFQLLEGAFNPTPVFLQLLMNCLKGGEDLSGVLVLLQELLEAFEEFVGTIPVAKQEELEEALEGLSEGRRAKILGAFTEMMS